MLSGVVKEERIVKKAETLPSKSRVTPPTALSLHQSQHSIYQIATTNPVSSPVFYTYHITIFSEYSNYKYLYIILVLYKQRRDMSVIPGKCVQQQVLVGFKVMWQTEYYACFNVIIQFYLPVQCILIIRQCTQQINFRTVFGGVRKMYEH